MTTEKEKQLTPPQTDPVIEEIDRAMGANDTQPQKENGVFRLDHDRVDVDRFKPIGGA